MKSLLPTLASLLLPVASAQSPRAVLVADGLERPTSICTPPGQPERLFITLDKLGVVLVDDGRSPTFFLDLTGQVGLALTGVNGMTFHPDYDQNGLFYIVYQNVAHESLVVQYQVSGDPDKADPASATIVMGPQPQPDVAHNWNCVKFGPDGMLYVSCGDGGPTNDPPSRGQDLGVTFGKLHRLDLDEPFPHVPADNPFVGVPGVEERIFAYGLRQPWRFSFDRLTGDIFIADVGLVSWEEIDFIPASSPGGENFGWECMESNECTHVGPCVCDDPQWIEPVHEYPTHAGGTCAIIGGYVYRGTAIPELQGAYVFGDYCSGRVWSFRYDGATKTDFREWTDDLRPCDGSELNRISSFGEDSDGELYVADVSDGQVFKIVPGEDTTYCVSKTSSLGCTPSIASTGVPSLSGSTFTITADEIVAQTTGVLLWGLAPHPPPGGGPMGQIGATRPGGTTCVTLRGTSGTLDSGGSAGCDGVLSFHFSQSLMFSEGLSAGTTVYAQFWYADPAHPDGSGVGHTNALAFTICP